MHPSCADAISKSLQWTLILTSLFWALNRVCESFGFPPQHRTPRRWTHTRGIHVWMDLTFSLQRIKKKKKSCWLAEVSSIVPKPRRRNSTTPDQLGQMEHFSFVVWEKSLFVVKMLLIFFLPHSPRTVIHREGNGEPSLIVNVGKTSTQLNCCKCTFCLGFFLLYPCWCWVYRDCTFCCSWLG